MSIIICHSYLFALSDRIRISNINALHYLNSGDDLIFFLVINEKANKLTGLFEVPTFIIMCS